MYLYCNKSLPKIFSEKLQFKSQFLWARIGITELNKQEFCFIHHAKIQIVSIDFNQLSSHILNFKKKLFEIINRNFTSYYWEFAFSIYKELGKKANLPMVYMNRFEIFQV